MKECSRLFHKHDAVKQKLMNDRQLFTDHRAYNRAGLKKTDACVPPNCLNNKILRLLKDIKVWKECFNNADES